MTTIRLGTGAVAVEVEDGAKVPLLSVAGTTAGDTFVGRVHLGAETLLLSVYDTRHDEKYVRNISSLTGAVPVGGWFAIDLAALRRERAPRSPVLDGWSFDGPYDPTPAYLMKWDARDNSARPAYYWTSRAGNTPEKQAAFDAAMEAWAVDWRRRMEKPGSGAALPLEMALWSAAAVLGYDGAKP